MPRSFRVESAVDCKHALRRQTRCGYQGRPFIAVNSWCSPILLSDEDLRIAFGPVFRASDYWPRLQAGLSRPSSGQRSLVEFDRTDEGLAVIGQHQVNGGTGESPRIRFHTPGGSIFLCSRQGFARPDLTCLKATSAQRLAIRSPARLQVC